MVLVLVEESVVGLKAPVVSKTTWLDPPGFKVSKVFDPVPEPKPEVLMVKAEYPPPAVVASVRFILCPRLISPLPAFAVKD